MQLVEGTIVQILGPDDEHKYYGTVIRNLMRSDFNAPNPGENINDFRYPHRFLVMSQNGIEHYHEARLVYVWQQEQEELKNDARK